MLKVQRNFFLFAETSRTTKSIEFEIRQAIFSVDFRRKGWKTCARVGLFSTQFSTDYLTVFDEFLYQSKGIAVLNWNPKICFKWSIFENYGVRDHNFGQLRTINLRDFCTNNVLAGIYSFLEIVPTWIKACFLGYLLRHYMRSISVCTQLACRGIIFEKKFS